MMFIIAQTHFWRTSQFVRCCSTQQSLSWMCRCTSISSRLPACTASHDRQKAHVCGMCLHLD